MGQKHIPNRIKIKHKVVRFINRHCSNHVSLALESEASVDCTQETLENVELKQVNSKKQ